MCHSVYFHSIMFADPGAPMLRNGRTGHTWHRSSCGSSHVGNIKVIAPEQLIGLKEKKKRKKKCFSIASSMYLLNV